MYSSARGLISLLLDRRESVGLELLVSNEHGNVPRGEAHEVRNEALVEGAEALALESGRYTIDDACVLACHHASLGDIEGRAEAASGEAGHDGAEEVKGHAVLHAGVLQDRLLVLIVRSDLGRVDNRVPENVRDDADPEASEASCGIGLSVAVNSSVI